MALVPSWLVVSDRTLADDARLLADVRVRSAHVPERLVWMLQRRTQGRGIITLTSENALPGPTNFPIAWHLQSRLPTPRAGLGLF